MKITGKVKAHREFRGVKETQITRITIKEPSGLGFFKESINKEFTGEQIKDIMEDPNLSSEQKCKRLFDRPEEYVVAVQGNFLNVEFLDKFVTDKYKNTPDEFKFDFKRMRDNIAANENINSFGVYTVFFDGGWKHNIEQSYEAYPKTRDVRGSKTEEEKIHA